MNHACRNCAVDPGTTEAARVRHTQLGHAVITTHAAPFPHTCRHVWADTHEHACTATGDHDTHVCHCAATKEQG